MTSDVENFVLNYNHASMFDKLKFDWNGKHGDEFEDKNYSFRDNIVLFLVKNFDMVSEQINGELLQDLYIEMAKSSKETWGISIYFGNIAEYMLKKGRTKYVMDYLDSLFRYGMDVYCGSSMINLDEDLKKELYDYCMAEFERTNLKRDDVLYEIVEWRFKENDQYYPRRLPEESLNSGEDKRNYLNRIWNKLWKK